MWRTKNRQSNGDAEAASGASHGTAQSDLALALGDCTESPALREVRDDISRLNESFERVRDEMERVVVGQQRLVHRMLVALLAGGHVLIEGVPGLAKTTAVATLARTLATSFRRLQFTPDLLPADLIGTQIYRPAEHRFEVERGPIFANVVLVDEINRAPAKVQTALLEAMQERQVTIGGETFALPDPFFVLATQNPIDHEGTYRLPEAQLDRFMLKVIVGYPGRDQELDILDRAAKTSCDVAVEPAMSPETLFEARSVLDRIHIDSRVKAYIVDLVSATRDPSRFLPAARGLIEFGASPRGTVALALAARGHAFLERRAYVTPHDVKSMALDVLRHRIILTYEAEAEEKTTVELIQDLLGAVPVP
jgi:MoxR-like ATPase